MKREEAVRLYTQQHLNMQDIADAAGVTRQAVQRMLKRAGVKRIEGTHVAGTCAYALCAKDILRIRARMLNGGRHYCSSACYHAARRSKHVD